MDGIGFALIQKVINKKDETASREIVANLEKDYLMCSLLLQIY